MFGFMSSGKMPKTPPPQSAKDDILAPKFSHSLIEDHREDGYWVETFHFDQEDRVPGVITSGLVSGAVEYLENPIATADYEAKTRGEPAQAADPSGIWKKYEIGKFDSPVAVTAVDITQNGLMDLVICHDYGPFMLECNPKGGFITWLENPGRDKLGEHWKERYIGRWPAMHRFKAGFFTQRSVLEIVAASVVYGPHDKTTPIPILGFRAPDKVLEAVEWDRYVINDEHFTVIHEIMAKKFDGPDGLDSILIASREGTTRLHYKEGRWIRDLISIGEPKEPRQSPTSETPGTGDHWGSGCVDAGRIGDDPFAYIATLDPFHGTTVTVLTKTARGINDCSWKRQILDVYGTPTQLQKTGDGPGHYIVCADFDGDGDDEFLVALFGSLDRDESGETLPAQGVEGPNKGVVYYKAIDLEKGLWTKYKVATESAARIAIGNFAGKDKIDFATITYNVKRYYEEPNPVVTIHLNEFAPPKPSDPSTLITPTQWAGEGMIYLPDPAKLSSGSALSLIEVANYAISVEVAPKGEEISVESKDGIKVLWGSLTDKKGRRSPLSVEPFTASATTSEDSKLKADEDKGAIFLRFKPIGNPTTWAKASDVPVKTTLDLSDSGLTFEPLKFIKVEDLWWGGGFKGVDFYNMTGFYFRFLEDKTQLAHLQFWTAGKNVNCGVHNHAGDIFEEIHVCLSPGTGDGGMWRLRPEFENTPPDELNDLGPEAFDQLVLPRLHEHGGIWYRDSYGNAVRGRDNVVAYPYHKWQGGGKAANVDVWLALEFNPDLDL